MSRTPQPLYRELASTFQAYLNCVASDAHNEWEGKHRESIETMCKEFLPSGSGIDCGTKLDFDSSKPDKLVLTFSFHHMHESGMYDGWTEHTLTVRPSLTSGIDLRISGRDRNQTKDYLYDVYDCALRQDVWQSEDGAWHSSAYSTYQAPQST